MGAKVLIFMDFFQGKNSVGKQKIPGLWPG